MNRALLVHLCVPRAAAAEQALLSYRFTCL